MNVVTCALAILSFSVGCWSVRVNEAAEIEDLDIEGESLQNASTLGDEDDGMQESRPLELESSGLDNLKRLLEIQATLQKNKVSKDPTPLTKLTKNKILFVTVNTRGKEFLRLPGPPGWDWEIHNIAAGKKFSGNGDIIKYMKEWIATVPDNQFVVYMDGDDVMYGGCDLDEFYKRYQRTSEAAGAKIVFGAEHGCWHPPTAGCDKYPESRRDKVLKMFGKTRKEIDYWGSHELKFLNAGVHMGRAKDLKVLYDEWWRHSAGKRFNQDGAAQFFQDHLDFVTLDYASLLVNNLFATHLQNHGRAMFTYDGENQVWMNAVMDKSVCFFHGNGHTGQREIFAKNGPKDGEHF